MAKIVEEVVAIKFSRIVRDGVDAPSTVTSELCAALEQVVQELAGETVVVEVIGDQ